MAHYTFHLPPPSVGDLCLFEVREEETSIDTLKITKSLQRECGPANTLIRSGFLFPLEWNREGFFASQYCSSVPSF